MSWVFPNGDGGTVPPVAENFLIHLLNNFFSWNHTIKRSFIAVFIDAVYIIFQRLEWSKSLLIRFPRLDSKLFSQKNISNSHHTGVEVRPASYCYLENSDEPTYLGLLSFTSHVPLFFIKQ